MSKLRWVVVVSFRRFKRHIQQRQHGGEEFAHAFEPGLLEQFL